MLTQRTDVSNKTKKASEVPHNITFLMTQKVRRAEHFMIKTCYLDIKKKQSRRLGHSKVSVFLQCRRCN